jgi:hypothetical protein
MLVRFSASVVKAVPASIRLVSKILAAIMSQLLMHAL